MDDVIVYRGKEYTREEILEMAKQIINRVKSIVEKIVEHAREIITNFISRIRSEPGFKRLLKKEQLLAYERDSVGKSNNWRKIHGLHLRRKIQATRHP